MIDTTEQTTCLACGAPLIQIAGRGHRKKLYCNDICRQRGHRRQAQSKVTPAVTNDDLQQRIAELERDLTEANELIEKLTSKKSNNPLKRSLQEKLTRVLEQRDWPRLDIHYRVNPGRKEGLAFILGASIELLSRALNQLEAEQS